MNQTRRHLNRSFALAFVLSASLASLPAETLIEQLYSQRDFELADAYWQAGKKFIDLGQAERGAEFQLKAKRLYPEYVPGKIPVFAPVAAATAPSAVTVAAAPVASVPDPQVVKEQNLQGPKIARLAWNKLLRAFLSQSTDGILSVLAPRLTLGNLEAAPGSNPVETAGLTPQISNFLRNLALDLSSPADLYDTSTLEVRNGTETDSVVLSIQASADAPAELAGLLPFWKPWQHFTFSRVGDTWKLSEIRGE